MSPSSPQLATATPRYPSARWVASPNYATGNRGRLAVVLHSAEGGYDGSITYMAAHGVSSHFIVSKAGAVSQLVSVNDTAYGNGLSYKNGQWYSPRDKIVTPTWQRITPGVNPNYQTISIEHEGYHSQPKPDAQIQATIALLRWLGQQFPSLLPYVPGFSLIGHGMLDTIDRINCPGPFFNLQAIAEQANAMGGFTPGTYRFPPLAVYERADLVGKIAKYLPSDSQADLEIDATSGPGYAATAGHLKDGSGFVDLRRLVRR